MKTIFLSISLGAFTLGTHIAHAEIKEAIRIYSRQDIAILHKHAQGAKWNAPIPIPGFISEVDEVAYGYNESCQKVARYADACVSLLQRTQMGYLSEDTWYSTAGKDLSQTMEHIRSDLHTLSVQKQEADEVHQEIQAMTHLKIADSYLTAVHENIATLCTLRHLDSFIDAPERKNEYTFLLNQIKL
jgi:hypothetical protein